MNGRNTNDSDSQSVNWNTLTTQTGTIYANLRKNKLRWIIGCIIAAILIILAITIPVTLIAMKKKNVTKETTTMPTIATELASTVTNSVTEISKETTIEVTLATLTTTAIPITGSTTITVFSTSEMTTITPTTTATATISKGNWLINGDAETGPCAKDNSILNPTGWISNGTITQVYYNNSYAELLSTDPGPSDRGNCCFYGQNAARVTSMWQIVDMTSSIDTVRIDVQTVWFNFSAWIGGYKNQLDDAQVSLTFMNEDNEKVGNTFILGPVTNIDREDITSMLFREVNGLVPVTARSFTVVVTITLYHGMAADGYVDNIAVHLYP